MQGSTPIPEIKETAEELKSLMRKCKKKSQERRIRMLWLFKTNQARTRKEAAELLPARNNTVGEWLEVYLDKGVEGLLNRSIPTGKRTRALVLPEAVHNALKARLEDPKQGFNGYEDARRWLAQEFNEDHTWVRIRAYIHRHFKAKIKVARPSHQKKTPQL